MPGEATFPDAIEYAFKKIVGGQGEEQIFIRKLFLKLDEWLTCSCESVYHYILRYYLEEYYNKIGYSINDEELLREIITNGGKRKKVDMAIGPPKEENVKSIEEREVVEIKMGKKKYSHISNSDFNKLFKGDFKKLIEIKKNKPEVRCYFLKITHDIPHSEKDRIMKKLTDVYKETIVGRFEELSKFDEDFKGYRIELVGKANYIIEAPKEKPKILAYHLWEIVKA